MCQPKTNYYDYMVYSCKLVLVLRITKKNCYLDVINKSINQSTNQSINQLSKQSVICYVALLSLLFQSIIYKISIISQFQDCFMTTQFFIEKLNLKVYIANIRSRMLPNLYDNYDKIKANGYIFGSLDCQQYVRTLDEHGNCVIFVTYQYCQKQNLLYLLQNQ